MKKLVRTASLLLALLASLATLGCGEPIPEGSFRLTVREEVRNEAAIEKELTVETSAPAVYFALGFGNPQMGLTGLSGDLEVRRSLRVFAAELPQQEIQIGFGHGGSSSEGPRALPEGMEFRDAVTFTDVSGTYSFGETILIGHVAGHDITLTVDDRPDGVLRGYAGTTEVSGDALRARRLPTPGSWDSKLGTPFCFATGKQLRWLAGALSDDRHSRSGANR